MDSKVIFLQNKILKWWANNKRDFCWRKSTASDYDLIITEILLQRTKAETVNKYYPIFKKKYSNWKDIWEASPEDIKSDLTPIGLQNQKSARLYELGQAIKKNNGQLPDTKDEVLKLPMIGQYIANAYSLFILKKPAPLLDVNMARVLERYFEPRTKADIRFDKQLQQRAYQIVDHIFATKINWGILDFSASICKIKSPHCVKCPLSSQCSYYSTSLDK